MRIKFWGVRGSTPTPQPENLRYGGNTSCVEVRVGDRIFVFDTAPGRLRAIVDSPVAGGRLSGDIRTHPDFGKSRAELRDMLRSEP